MQLTFNLPFGHYSCACQHRVSPNSVATQYYIMFHNRLYLFGLGSEFKLNGQQQFFIHLVDMSSFNGNVFGVNDKVHDVRQLRYTYIIVMYGTSFIHHS